MKMKAFKKKKEICRALKKIFIITAIAGLLMILGAAESADLEKITFEGLLLQVASGCIVIWVSGVLICITDEIEHYIKTKK